MSPDAAVPPATVVNVYGDLSGPAYLALKGPPPTRGWPGPLWSTRGSPWSCLATSRACPKVRSGPGSPAPRGTQQVRGRLGFSDPAITPRQAGVELSRPYAGPAGGPGWLHLDDVALRADAPGDCDLDVIGAFLAGVAVWEGLVPDEDEVPDEEDLLPDSPAVLGGHRPRSVALVPAVSVVVVLPLTVTGWRERLVNLAVVGAAVGVDLLAWFGRSRLRDGTELPGFVIPAVAVAVGALLLARRRHPVAVLGAVAAYTLLAVVVAPRYQPFAVLLVAVHAVARRCPRTVAVAGLVVAWLLFAGLSVNAADYAEGPLRIGAVVVAQALWTLAVVAVWSFGRVGHAGEQRALRQERRHAEQEVAALRAERLRLARELHDIVAHSVSAMVLQAAGAKAVAGGSQADGQVREALQAIESTGVEAMRELHRLLGLLRSVEGAAGAEADAPTATLREVDALVAATRGAGVDVERAHRRRAHTRSTGASSTPRTGWCRRAWPT